MPVEMRTFLLLVDPELCSNIQSAWAARNAMCWIDVEINSTTGHHGKAVARCADASGTRRSVIAADQGMHERREGLVGPQ